MKFSIRKITEEFEPGDELGTVTVDGAVSVQGDEMFKDLVNYSPEFGRADVSAMSPEDATLWLRGLMNQNFGQSLMPFTDSEELTAPLSDEEYSRLEGMVQPRPETDDAPETPKLPTRLTRRQ